MNLIILGAKLGVIIAVAFIVYTAISALCLGIISAITGNRKKGSGNEKSK